MNYFFVQGLPYDPTSCSNFFHSPLFNSLNFETADFKRFWRMALDLTALWFFMDCPGLRCHKIGLIENKIVYRNGNVNYRFSRDYECGYERGGREEAEYDESLFHIVPNYCNCIMYYELKIVNDPVDIGDPKSRIFSHERIQHIVQPYEIFKMIMLLYCCEKQNEIFTILSSLH